MIYFEGSELQKQKKKQNKNKNQKTKKPNHTGNPFNNLFEWKMESE